MNSERNFLTVTTFELNFICFQLTKKTCSTATLHLETQKSTKETR